MRNEDLPDDGDLRLGSLRLRGQRVDATLSRGRPVAWVTDEPVPDAGRAWLAISGMAAKTGLRPVLDVPSVPGPLTCWPWSAGTYQMPGVPPWRSVPSFAPGKTGSARSYCRSARALRSGFSSGGHLAR
jgi:hypothetical protein